MARGLNTMITAVAKIIGEEHVSNNPEILQEYSKDLQPSLVVWPKLAEEVAQIVAWANSESVALVPVSSGTPRLRDDSSPKVEGSIILDLSKMDRIIRLDSKNKVVMVEPGVTYGQLIPELKKQGLRPLMPLLPKATKSVLTSSLDREPITTPRFHWDTSDPLLCTETVYGTGDLFRTGAAAGPGTIEEQWSTGQAQKNPMGPSQFDPYRLLQGAQGTIGIVTWASVKCEVLPDIHKLFLAGSDNIEPLIDFSYKILRRRLLDEHFILNATSLAAATEIEPSNEWILVAGISGHGPLSQEAYDYRLEDTKDIANETGVALTDSLTGINASNFVNCPSEEPYWKLRPMGGVREILFTTTLDKAHSIYTTLLGESRRIGYTSPIGAYIQPTVQGVNTHCSFDLYYDPNKESERELIDTLYLEGSKKLMSDGAFFSRPFGSITDAVFEQASPEIVNAMRQVKRIFDPNNVLNPGTLCFKEVPK